MRSSSMNMLGTVATVVTAAIVLAACGSSPTSGSSTTSGSSPTSGSSTTSGSSGSGDSDDLGFASVYEAVEGLTGTEREQKLIELAMAEGGEVSIYHTGKLDAQFADFTERTGIKVTSFQATNEQVSQRAQQEAQTGRPGSDVLDTDAGSLTILNDEKAIAPLRTPNLEQILPEFTPPGLEQPNQIPWKGILKLPGYNTDMVEVADLPQSWTDLFESYEGSVGIEQTDWSWYAALVTKWFMAEKGMSESDAIKLITDGLQGVTAVNGHPLETQLLASGQYGVALTFYAHFMSDLQESNAPVAFMPDNDQMPVVLTIGNNAALTANAPHPAAGLLLLEYLTGEGGQALVAEQGYIPSYQDFSGDTLLNQYSNLIIDDSTAQGHEYAQKWQDAFDTLLQEVGGTQIDG